MRVLVTGGHGFVGSSIRATLAAHGVDVIAPSHSELELVDGDAVATAVTAAAPDAVVHAAIWNDPAGLRADRRRAWDEYVGATRHVVDAAGDAPVVLVSTDWVFAGDGGAPYAEHDAPCPINAYGFLKAACELVVAERARHGIVARISGVQGPSRGGPGEQDAGFGSFVTALVDRLRAGTPFTVWTGAGVNATATPTLAIDVADMIERALEIAVAGGPGSLPPVLHCCGGEATDRVGLAQRAAAAFDLDPALIRTGPAPPEALADGPTPADTPLDARATASVLGIELPDLDATLARLRAQLGNAPAVTA